MTSTRNKNTGCDYKLEQNVNINRFNHNLYLHSSSGRPTSECLPSIGYTPSHMSRDALANNAVDIESALYGIGSTNLVNPQTPVKPDIKPLQSLNVIDKLPIMIPEPLIIEKNQRPLRE